MKVFYFNSIAMDDKEKYNKALERARVYRDNARAVGDYAAVARYENIFPELRESENERIRKALIEALKVSETIGELKFRLPYPTREECIAYLEKQKEQMMKEFPKWRRIKAGERLPCPAYVWTIAYDNYPDCFEGRLMPNIQGVKVGRDTWYLPVDVIHNLPKED